MSSQDGQKQKTHSNLRTALYIRVSTKEQEIEGYGLDSQKKALIAYTKANSALKGTTSPSLVFSDTHTGSDTNRPSLQSLLELVRQKKVDTIVVWKIDRLSRSLSHLLDFFETFQKYGVNFISIQENMTFTGAVGKFIFSILSSVAELERNLIKTRTTAGKIASAEMGNYTGTFIPYGYRPVPNPNGKGKKLELVEEECKRVREIYNWYIFEDMGYGQIADRLNSLKVPKGRHKHIRFQGGKWTPDIVEKIIKNPLYRGEFVANRKDENGMLLPVNEWTIVSIPPCVDEIVFAMAQNKRKERKGKRKRTGHQYLLSGKLVDISTPYHKKFVGIPRAKGGHSYRRLQFVDKKEVYHNVFEFPAEPVETAVWNTLKEALENPRFFLQKHLITGKPEAGSRKNTEKKLKELREEKANLLLAKGRIELAYEEGVYDLGQAESRINEKNESIAANDSLRVTLERELDTEAKHIREVQGLFKASGQYRAKLDMLTRKQKRHILDTFIQRIEVDRKEQENPGGKRKKWQRFLKIIFRFDHSLSLLDDPDSRTLKPAGTAQKGTSGTENGNFGGRAYGRLHSLSVKFEFAKECFKRQQGGKTWRIALKPIGNVAL